MRERKTGEIRDVISRIRSNTYRFEVLKDLISGYKELLKTKQISQATFDKFTNNSIRKVDELNKEFEELCKELTVLEDLPQEKIQK